MSPTRRQVLYGLPAPLRSLLGLVPAALVIGILLLLPVQYRAPYVLAYLFSVVTCWYLGLSAGVLCSVASGIAIESFLALSPIVPRMWTDQLNVPRLLFFVGCTALVGSLMKRVITLQERNEAADLRRQLEQAQSESRHASERALAAQALHERETRLQMALDGGHVGLWDEDLEHGRALWSDEHYRILGLEPGSISVAGYQTVRASIHPDDLEFMDALFHETSTHARPFCCEYRIVRPDGDVRWVEAQARYETNAEGKAVRMLGVMADITHRKQAQDVLLRTEKLAAAGRLAASIAHEINNPLEAITNLLYLIAHANDLDTAQLQAQRALDEVLRVSRITQQTLKFHRQSEPASKVRLSEIIEDVVELSRGRLANAHVAIHRRYQDDPELECLAGDLRQVFANLISNSLDAMGQSGGSLVIRLRRARSWRAPHVPGLRISILDTGCGMDAQTRRRIYEPFFTTKRESGTGLGLWLTSEIIERQQGSLHVWSSQLAGRSGTAFSIFLPFSENSLGALAGSEAPAFIAGS
ncbi:MAG TPA: PAS domain-containing protein [Acidobacteriaceae bacterium]|nr:PAS domain-containing protein [Acidobacteriaceae bacterium]